MSDDIKPWSPEIYEELRGVARLHLKNERKDHTLSATALVNEAYLRLAAPREKPWQNRRHFFAAAVESMRHVLLDHARNRNRDKRGGGRRPLNLDNVATLVMAKSPDAPDFIALDVALCRLKERDPRMAEVVGLRFYAGLTNAEAAELLGVSERTVKNDWTFAKAWLTKELEHDQ